MIKTLVSSTIKVLCALICVFFVNVSSAAADNRTEQISTMFLKAINDGDLNTAQSMLDSGADINFTHGGEIHALAMAFRWHRNINCSPSDIVSFLIKRGANVNATFTDSFFGWDKSKVYNVTPLMIGVKSNYTSVYALQLLVENGANVNAADSNGNSVLHYAVPSLINAGVPSGRDGSSGVRLGGGSGMQVIAYLVSKGANPNYRNNSGVTPFLLLADNLPGERAGAASRHLELVKFMIKYGADPNISVNGIKPIDLAFRKNNIPVYQYLLGLERGTIPKEEKPPVRPDSSEPMPHPGETKMQMPQSELNIGGITVGKPLDYVEQMYGKPGRVDDEGFFQTYSYNDSFVVKAKLNNGYKVVSVASYENKLATPGGLKVGMPFATVVKRYGPVEGEKFKSEGVEAKLKGCKVYTYFCGNQQVVFLVDNSQIIRGIRVEEIDEQKVIEAKREKRYS